MPIPTTPDPAMARCWRRPRPWRSCGHGSASGRGGAAAARLGRDARHQRCARLAAAGRPRAGQRPGGDGVSRLPRRGQRRLQAQRRPDLRRLRAGALRRLHHRGDLRPAGVPPSAAGAGDRQAAGQRRAVPRAHPCRRLLRAGQVPAADRAAAPGRLGPADLAARRARRVVRAL